MAQHPLFIKYRRTYLHQATGYSLGYFSRLALGKTPLSRAFIERVSFRLGQPEAELFLPQDVQVEQCSEPSGCSNRSLGQWLDERMKYEHLSLRQAAAKTGLSHTTIQDILKGEVRASPETIKSLARGFGGDSSTALELHLLVLAGYLKEGSEENQLPYLKAIPLLSPEHQHIVELVVGGLAKLEGIEVAPSTGGEK